MTTEMMLFALVALLLALPYAAFLRLTRSRGSVTWEVSPLPKHEALSPEAARQLRMERDEARRELAEWMRDSRKP
jgi:hypothetical protein